MTAGANPLTARAVSPGASFPPSTAVQFRAFVDALERLGYDVDALLRRVGIARESLEDPDGLVPCVKTGELFCQAVRQRPLKNIGVHVGVNTPVGASGLIDYLILTAPTVGAALRQAERYFGATSSAPFGVAVDDERDPVRIRLVAGPGVESGVEYSTARIVTHLRSETGQRAIIDSVSFVHRPEDVADIERVLGCPVQAGATWNGVSVPRSTLELPLRRADPHLQRVLESRALSATDLASPAGGVAFDVRQVIVSRLRDGVPDVGDVARHLGVSPRTLQRRLADAGLSYNRVLEDTRRRSAENWLAGSELAIGEIAYLLGYAEPAAFHRAFKRWTGATPQAFRRARALR